MHRSCLKLWFQRNLYFCDIAKSGWFLKRLSRKKSPKESLPKVSSEAAVRRCFSKQVFLEISQYSQENMCLSVFLKKCQALRPATVFKRDFSTCVFLSAYFMEHLQWLFLSV